MTHMNIDSVLVSQYLDVTNQIEELEQQIYQLTVTRNELIAQGLPSVFECRTGYQTYKGEYDYDDFKFIICLKSKPPIKSIVEGDLDNGIYATTVYQDNSKEQIENNNSGFLAWADTEKEAWKKAVRNAYCKYDVNKYLGWPY